MLRTRSHILDRRQAGTSVLVACTRAVPEFAYVVIAVWIFIFLVGAWFEVVCMAAGTIRLILGRWPGHKLGISTMAIRASQICTMVSGIPARQVAENQRRPEIVVMAVVALETGFEMRSAHTRRRSAIMASRTGTRDTVVVEISWYPGHRGVADITFSKDRKSVV